MLPLPITCSSLRYGVYKKSITYPPGAYDVKAMAGFIITELIRKGDDKAFRLGANTNTLKAVIDANLANCVVNIGESTIKSILVGWATGDLAQGTHMSPDKVNITNVSKVLVHCNIAQGAYSVDTNGILSSRTVMGYFFPNVAPGYDSRVTKGQNMKLVATGWF